MSPGLAHLEGKYEILAKIKEGGMGAIYKVRHRLLDEIRVVKTLRRELESDAGLRERFIHEARSAIRLRHPNVVQIFDFLIESGVGYIVMEYIDGVDLAELIRRGGRLSLPLFLELAGQGLRALGYLHHKGFVHRDVSPDNLMLTSDFAGRPLVKMIDLGIAKNVERGPAITSSGMFLGKFRYSSPEHFGTQGTRGIEARSDLYSFGVVLYELATGIYPIQGEDSPQLIAGHLFHPPRPFAETDPEERLPEALRAVLLKSLDKDPGERFASAEDFAAALAELRSQFPVTAATCEEARGLRGLRAAAETVTSDSAQEALDHAFNRPTPSRGVSAAVGSGVEEVRLEHVAALMGGAEALLRLGQPVEARDQLLAVLRLDPDHARARRLLGEIDGDLAAASAETVSWRQAPPPPSPSRDASPAAPAGREEGLFDHHLQTACALAEDGSFADAIPHFEAALAVQPENEAVRRMLDESQHKLADEQRASRDRLADEVRQLRELVASGDRARARDRLVSARRAYGDVDDLAELRREIELAESRERLGGVRETLSEVVRLREAGEFTFAVRELESARKAWRSAGPDPADEKSELAAEIDHEASLLEEAHRKAAARDEAIYAVESAIAAGKLVEADRALFQAFEAFGKIDRLRELRKELDELHHRELELEVRALLDEAASLVAEGEIAGARSSLDKARIMAPGDSALAAEIEERRRSVDAAAVEWGKRRHERLAAEIERLIESRNLEQAEALMSEAAKGTPPMDEEEQALFDRLRERIADAFQERVNALIHEAGLAIEARRYAAAIPFLEQALDLSPDDDWLADRLAQAKAAVASGSGGV